MKFTWGHAAVAIPVTIVVVFTTVLIRSMSDEHKTELVTENYYAKELAYQDQIDKTSNAGALNSSLNWKQSPDLYSLNLNGDFDPEETEGFVSVFRPSDSGLDFEVALDLDADGNQNFDLNKFKKGKYQIQVLWIIDETECYLEKNIFIQ